MKKAIFLDKDGTLVKNVPYSTDLKRITILPGVAEGLRDLYSSGYELVIATNQGGIALGKTSERDVLCVGEFLTEHFKRHGVPVSGFYFCPHLPEGTIEKYSIECDCRKPRPGLLEKAAIDLNIDLENSWMIGDILTDVQAGRMAGCKTILINNGNDEEWQIDNDNCPDFMVTDFKQAADSILESKIKKYFINF